MSNWDVCEYGNTHDVVMEKGGAWHRCSHVGWRLLGRCRLSSSNCGSRLSVKHSAIMFEFRARRPGNTKLSLCLSSACIILQWYKEGVLSPFISSLC
jgi:hypothetical protein